MKNKTVFRDIAVNPYRMWLWLLVTDNPSFECSRLNQRHKGLELKWPENAAAITGDLYKGTFLPVVFDAREKFDISTVTHEVVHIKNMVNDHAGIIHDPNNDETEAYLSGWLADEIHKCWLDYKKL